MHFKNLANIFQQYDYEADFILPLLIVFIPHLRLFLLVLLIITDFVSVNAENLHREILKNVNLDYVFYF